MNELHGGAGKPWLGGRRNSANKFVWSDGTPWDYSNWLPNEPNSSGDEDCVHTATTGWNDLRCNHLNIPYICKKGKIIIGMIHSDLKIE